MTMLDGSLTLALVDAVKALGGSKVVGCKIWPEKAPDAAQRLLLDCLNDDRPAHLTPDHVRLILRLARQRGHHDAVAWLLADLGYAPPVPVEPADVLGELQRELQREFIAATRQMANMAARIERMQAGAAHATVGGVAASVPLHAINAPYGTPVRGVA
jgi:hypothetical protein